jgi:hypothetical protein
MHEVHLGELLQHDHSISVTVITLGGWRRHDMASLQDNQRSQLQITATADHCNCSVCATFWLKEEAPFRFSQYRQKLSIAYLGTNL